MKTLVIGYCFLLPNDIGSFQRTKGRSFYQAVFQGGGCRVSPKKHELIIK
jgi:hypothetical protein